MKILYGIHAKNSAWVEFTALILCFEKINKKFSSKKNTNQEAEGFLAEIKWEKNNSFTLLIITNEIIIDHVPW